MWQSERSEKLSLHHRRGVTWSSGNHFFNKRALSLSSGLSGSWVDSERCAASSLSPTIPPIASGQEIAVWGCIASPRVSGQSLQGQREFCCDEPEHAAFWAIQHDSPLLHLCGISIVPLVPLVQSLGAWLELPNPSRWLIRTVRVGYVIQFARRLPRFSSVPKICDNPRHHCSVRGYCCPVGEGCNQACPSSWDEAGVLQPLLHCAK